MKRLAGDDAGTSGTCLVQCLQPFTIKPSYVRLINCTKTAICKPRMPQRSF